MSFCTLKMYTYLMVLTRVTLLCQLLCLIKKNPRPVKTHLQDLFSALNEWWKGLSWKGICSLAASRPFDQWLINFTPALWNSRKHENLSFWFSVEIEMVKNSWAGRWYVSEEASSWSEAAQAWADGCKSETLHSPAEINKLADLLCSKTSGSLNSL